MRRLLLLALAASALQAASIRGSVVENMTGRALARTRVTLAPVPGSPGPSLTVRTSLSGNFEFTALPAGTYLISAARAGFAPVEYGQKEFRSAAQPIVLEESTPVLIEIRMKRYGAVAGTVLDENDVGIPETKVVAYRDTQPPQLAGNATTDDRGMYRVAGLAPGRYLIRTGAKQLEDGGYLPTFSKQSVRVEDALPLDALAGALLSLSGSVILTPRQPVTVTLVSDMGRDTYLTSSEFHFDNLAPGPYELFAETDSRSGMLGAYTLFAMDRDRSDMRLALNPIPDTPFFIRDEGGKAVQATTVQVLARRKDLAGAGPARTLRIDANRALLGPGRWDLMLAPMPNYYVSRFSGPANERSERKRADVWNEITVGGGYNPVFFALASNPGTLHGTVMSGQNAVVGAMVFLEPWDAAQRKRLGDLRTVRTDLRGQYQFRGLAPGDYRLMATFEYQMPDEAEMDRTETRMVKAEAGSDLVQNLDLFVIR